MQESTRQQYLQAMGVQLWESRFSPAISVVEPVVETTDDVAIDISSVADQPETEARQSSAELDWPALQAKVESCVECHLHESRIYPVLGAGDQNAKVMFIGEAPGADEDRQGEPFVGQAGHLLNEMLTAIGFKREQVYMANILKCRPPNNREPEALEISCCEGFLQRQITLVQPDLIVALGRVAAQNLLKSESDLGNLRGQLHQGPGINAPIMATFHPAYLLKKPLEKRKAWDDLKLILAFVNKGETV